MRSFVHTELPVGGPASLHVPSKPTNVSVYSGRALSNAVGTGRGGAFFLLGVHIMCMSKSLALI